VTAFERDKKRVITAQGWLDYDYLIVGAGIRYNYEAWFGNDRKAADYTKAISGRLHPERRAFQASSRASRTSRAATW
jgi:NADH dehydrogenase FAD-containing subunit